MNDDLRAVPDFSQWTTQRLLFLHDEYEESLKSIGALYGKKHSEYKLYTKWLNAIDAELTRRDPK